jgi:isopenicillin-N N-acyltransferase-like protein
MLSEFECSGAPYDRGFAHGKYFAKVIESNMELNKYDLTAELDELGRGIGELMEREFPDLAEEMRGIADGAGIRRDAVIAWNTGYALRSGCSCFAFTDSDVGPVMGNTLDEYNDQPTHTHANTVMRVRPTSGYACLGIGTAGSVRIGPGINEKGLCLGDTTVVTTDRCDLGVTKPVLFRAVLQSCADVPEAIEFLGRYPDYRWAGTFVLCDAQGRAAVVEKSHRKQGHRYAVDGVIYAVNHFETPEMVDVIPSREKAGERAYWSVAHRREKLDRILREEKWPRTLATVKKILTDHTEPGPICRHGRKEKGFANTIQSYINIPRQRKFLITNWNPCISRFAEYSL